MSKPRYNRDENPQLYELTLVLGAAWDPIGAGTGVPTDEYEVYAAPILALLQTCSSDESRGSPDAFQALVAELSRIRTERIGLEPEPDADRSRLGRSGERQPLWRNRYRQCVACDDDRGEELSYARRVSSGNRRLSGGAHHTEV